MSKPNFPFKPTPRQPDRLIAEAIEALLRAGAMPITEWTAAEIKRHRDMLRGGK